MVTIETIADTLGMATTDLGTLLSSDRINPASQRKPMRVATPGVLDPSQFVGTGSEHLQGIYFGVKMATHNVWNISEIDYSYTPPTGGAQTPYRLTDMNGYNHKATYHPTATLTTTPAEIFSGEPSEATITLHDGTGCNLYEAAGAATTHLCLMTVNTDGTQAAFRAADPDGKIDLTECPTFRRPGAKLLTAFLFAEPLPSINPDFKTDWISHTDAQAAAETIITGRAFALKGALFQPLQVAARGYLIAKEIDLQPDPQTNQWVALVTLAEILSETGHNPRPGIYTVTLIVNDGQSRHHTETTYNPAPDGSGVRPMLLAIIPTPIQATGTPPMVSVNVTYNRPL